MKISKIYSNKHNIFEPIYFNLGLDPIEGDVKKTYFDLLNVIFAEVKKSKDEKSDSHNLGKTTLLYLLDFMFLKEINQKTSKHFLHINKNLFDDFIFFIEISLNSREFLTIRRSVKDNTKIFFKKHTEYYQDFSNLTYCQWDNKDVPMKKARQLLDSYLNLSVISPWDYRKGISYFLRTQQDYNDFFQIAKFLNSDHKDWKPYIAHILGFNGNVVREKYDIDEIIEEKDKERKRKQKELSYSEEDYNKLSSIIKLEKNELDSIEKKLDSFSFEGEEKKINKELIDDIELEIASINNRIFDIGYDIRKIESSLKEKLSFKIDDIRKVYEDVNIYFPEELLKNYKELLKFNKEISKERNKSLNKRLKELKDSYELLQSQLHDLDIKRSESLKILGCDDTFDKYKSLQKQFSKKKADLIHLEQQYNKLKELVEISAEISKLNNQRDQKVEEMRSFIQSPNEIYDNITKDFGGLVKTVLNAKGVLYADINKKGNLEFNIEILKDDSSLDFKTSQTEGTSYKKLLCMLFDLAILRTYANNNFYHFVYHDGIFEGLDNRKKTTLLNVIKETCQLYKIQYLLSVIDTDLPRDKQDNKINFNDNEIIIKLNDSGQSGRLFKMDKF